MTSAPEAIPRGRRRGVGTGRTRLPVLLLGAALLAAVGAAHHRELGERDRRRSGTAPDPTVPAASQPCADCHGEDHPGVVASWRKSAHARAGIGCVDCHRAEPTDADGYEHYGERIATVVTPRDCGSCHETEAEQYAGSRHAAAAHLPDAAQWLLVSTAFGTAADPDAGRPVPSDEPVVVAGCDRCHGSVVALLGTAGQRITVDDLAPDTNGRPTRPEVVAQVARTPDGRVKLASGSWPNTGTGRRNLDGSRGSCSACHGRHEFSVARAREPDSCGWCHRGLDQPQLEVYRASKHAAALSAAARRAPGRALVGALGRQDVPAPTCATCHLSGHSGNGWAATHDPRGRLSWSLHPVQAVRRCPPEDRGDPACAGTDEGRDTWQDRRRRMTEVCLHCHGPEAVTGFFAAYDGTIELVNDRFTAPGEALIAELRERGALTAAPFDEPVEWAWFDLWHRRARRARLGAAMMSPDDVHGGGLAALSQALHGDLLVRARGLLPTPATGIDGASVGRPR